LKRILRNQVLDLRSKLSSEERKGKSWEIEKRLFSLPEFQESRTILFFASFRSEVETGGMIRRALSGGKRVVLPKVKGKELVLFRITDFDNDVAAGAWGIPEPEKGMPTDLQDIDLIIVPGAAFDELGNRLGYGAGFYDKLLSSYRKATVALAFECQIVPAVPADHHDIPVKKIVTEKRIIETNSTF
jgi:5-formyltetrahydrofolate cyclo-ligase